MTTYEIPAEPDAQSVWTVHEVTGKTTRWYRETTTESVYWRREDALHVLSWANLLNRHCVHDEDPRFLGIPERPWKVDGTLVMDARGKPLFLVDNPFTSDEDFKTAAFVVEAVNAYEGVLGGSTDELRAGDRPLHPLGEVPGDADR